MKSDDLTQGDFGALLASQAGLEGLSEKYHAFLESIVAAEEVPARVLVLCYQRIRQIHGLVPNDLSTREADSLTSQNLDAFSNDEQVALAAAEKIPFQHHSLLDEEVRQIRAAFGDKGCVNLLTALSFFDVSCRLDLTFTQTEL